MYVNAFWFGFLIAMVVILVLTIVLALIKARQDEEEWLENQPTEEEIRESLEELTGKKFRMVKKGRTTVWEMQEDEDGKE